MAELAKSAVLNLRDYGITIGGKDFPWFVGDNISVETETQGTDTGTAFRRLRLDVLIDGDVIIEGDPAQHPDYRR